MGLLHFLEAVADTAWISIPTLADSWAGRLTPAKCDARLAWWSEDIVRRAGVRLEVRGAEHAAGDDPLVVMSNHQSFYDIPVLYQAVPGRLRMVAKAELFDVPVFAGAMRAAGFVRVERQNRERAVESLKAATRLFADGTRVWIAPEGTRSPTGELGPFKSGGFRMAIDTRTPILPIGLWGTRDVLPAHGIAVRTGQRVRVVVRPRIDPAPYGLEGRKALMADVRAAMESALLEARDG
jgi:1-acyl-sn-glycerol-3-phosphate acyltransferase